jgi:cytochrome b pre-mRNA-processing protein 3
MGVPDTPNGRFELYSLHVLLLLRRLKGAGEAGAETAQVLFDTFISSLDDALREQGVGDLSVAKKMRKLGEAFYGRVKSYDEAMSALPDTEALHALIRRTVCADGGDAEALTRYAAEGATELSGLSDADVLSGRIRWPEVQG